VRHYHILEAIGGMHAHWQLREDGRVFFSAEDAVEVLAQAHDLGPRDRDLLRRYWYVDVFYPAFDAWERLAESGFAHGMPLLVKRLPIRPPWWRRPFDRRPRLGMSRLVIMFCDRASCTEESPAADQ